MSSQRIAVDSLEFTGRFKTQPRRSAYERRPTILLQRSGPISDFVKPQSIVEQPVDIASSSQSSQNFDAFRQLASPAPTQTTHFKKQFDAPPKPKKPIFNIMASVLVAVLFVAGVGTAVLQLRTNKHVAAQMQQGDVARQQSDGINSLEETKPTNIGSYSVSPGQPRFIRIAKLDVSARIRKVGVKANNELVAPTNIHDAGWYEESAKPGDAGGAILIDGHVHGPTMPGVFSGLKNLLPGDKIQLERGDGQLANFKVVKLQSYDANNVDMAAALTPVVPGKLGLNLITCTGKLDKSGNSYTQRLIVFATQE